MDWLRDSPSVNHSLVISILGMREPGEGVLVFTPVFDFFINCVRVWGRKLVCSRMGGR